MLEHGGRLRRAAAEYGRPLEDWVDLSTGIAPYTWLDSREATVPTDAWLRLPETDDGLEAAAAACYGATALPLAGSQAAIQTLPRLRSKCRVGVLGPTYAEHPESWHRAGHTLLRLGSIAEVEALLHTLDVLVVVNPNNPDGRLLPATLLQTWRAQLADRNGWLIVDEAFMDPTPQLAMLQASTDHHGLLVLRSLGKFFGLAGARVGFALGDPVLLHALERQLGPWTLAGPSRVVARLALADLNWHRWQRHRLQVDSQRLQRVLNQHGLLATGGTDLFQWVPLPDAPRLQHALCEHGVLVRRFDAQVARPAGLRFGLPRGTAAWERLTRALQLTSGAAA